MDTTTSIKMTTLAIQNLFSYVEEENLSALKAHLDRFKEVDGRSDVRTTSLTTKFILTFLSQSNKTRSSNMCCTSQSSVTNRRMCFPVKRFPHILCVRYVTFIVVFCYLLQRNRCFFVHRTVRLPSCWRLSRAVWRLSRSSSGEEPTSTWTTW